jgi:hypothetical protein
MQQASVRLVNAPPAVPSSPEEDAMEDDGLPELYEVERILDARWLHGVRPWPVTRAPLKCAAVRRVPRQVEGLSG